MLRSPAVSLGALALGLWRGRRSKPLTRRYDVAEPRLTTIHLEQAEQAAVRDQKLCIITGGTSRMLVVWPGLDALSGYFSLAATMNAEGPL